MATGTHKGAYLAPQDTFADDHILTRGQTINGIYTTTAIDVILRLGQMSLHHWRVAHASALNQTKDHRIGFAPQADLPPNTQQLEGRCFEQTVRCHDNVKTMQKIFGYGCPALQKHWPCVIGSTHNDLISYMMGRRIGTKYRPRMTIPLQTSCYSCWFIPRYIGMVATPTGFEPVLPA